MRVIFFLLFSIFILNTALVEAKTLVLKNLNLVDFQSNSTRFEQTVVIEGRNISRILPSHNPIAINNAINIDMKGKYALSGTSYSELETKKKSAVNAQIALAPFNFYSYKKAMKILPLVQGIKEGDLANLIILSAPPKSAETEQNDVVHVIKQGAFIYIGADRRLPFVNAKAAGNILWLSGQIGNLPSTMVLAGADIETQMVQAMENVGSVLHEHGLDYSDIAKCTLMLANINDWSRASKIYTRYFDLLPARSAFATSGLALGAKVEIECVATIERHHYGK